MVAVKNRDWSVCPKCGEISVVDDADADGEREEGKGRDGRDWIWRLPVVAAVVLALVLGAVYCGWWE
jgi:hypothetical protein